jgi:hypothetical protein
MTPADHQAIVDASKVVVSEFFGHYLDVTFPAQIERILRGHNHDVEAHAAVLDVHTKTCPTKKRVDKLKWMIAGGAAVAGSAAALLAEHLPAVIRALMG